MSNLDEIKALISDIEQLNQEFRTIKTDLAKKEKRLIDSLDGLTKKELDDLGYKVIFVRNRPFSFTPDED